MHIIVKDYSNAMSDSRCSFCVVILQDDYSSQNANAFLLYTIGWILSQYKRKCEWRKCTVNAVNTAQITGMVKWTNSEGYTFLACM